MEKFKKTGLFDGSGSEGEENERKENKGGGNTRLPYGLCERYHIALPDGATPREAWAALEGKGITPDKAYAELKDKADVTDENRDFEQAKTIAEAEQYAKDNFGVNCSYSGVDLEVANQMNKALARGFAICPQIKDTIKFVGSAQQRNAARKAELVQYYANWIRKNYSYLSEQDILWQAKKLAAEKVGRIRGDAYAVASDGGATGDTEFKEIAKRYGGIFVNNAYGKDISKFKQDLKKDLALGHHPIGCDTIDSVFDHEVAHTIDYSVGLRKNSEILAIYNSLSKYEISKGLSGYANKNIGEFIAESWAEYKNNPMPREIATKVGKIIEKVVKNNGR